MFAHAHTNIINLDYCVWQCIFSDIVVFIVSAIVIVLNLYYKLFAHFANQSLQIISVNEFVSNRTSKSNSHSHITFFKLIILFITVFKAVIARIHPGSRIIHFKCPFNLWHAFVFWRIILRSLDVLFNPQKPNLHH